MFFGGQGFPFGGMEDDEDFPGMMGGRGPPKEVDNKALYEALGVEKDATMDQIRKAYRKKAMKAHPDKGGDPEEVSRFQNSNVTNYFSSLVQKNSRSLRYPIRQGQEGDLRQVWYGRPQEWRRRRRHGRHFQHVYGRRKRWRQTKAKSSRQANNPTSRGHFG